MTAPTQEVRPFYRAHNKGSTEGALQDCLDAGFRVLSLPRVADKRMQRSLSWNEWLTIWNEWFTTISPIITGIPTGEKEAFVIYWHEPTEFATPKGIRTAKTEGLVNGAGRASQGIFDAIYIAAAQTPHLIIPYRKLLELKSDPISIADAEKDLRVIASLDGAERTGRYLPAHARAYNTNQIDVWHSNDFDEQSPRWRLLSLGYYDINGFVGSLNLDDDSQFVGVRDITTQGSTQNLEESVESVESIGNRHIQALGQLMRERRNLR